MSKIKAYVETQLKNYTALKQEVMVLEFELEALTAPLDEDVIEGKVLHSRSADEWVTGTFQTDKTADIAIRHVDSQHGAKYLALKKKIHVMRLEACRLEYYLTLLPKEEAEVIRLFYFDGLGWADITKQSTCSYSTLRRRKEHGLDKLTRYYSIVEGFAEMK